VFRAYVQHVLCILYIWRTLYIIYIYIYIVVKHLVIGAVSCKSKSFPIDAQRVIANCLSITMFPLKLMQYYLLADLFIWPRIFETNNQRLEKVDTYTIGQTLWFVFDGFIFIVSCEKCGERRLYISNSSASAISRFFFSLLYFGSLLQFFILEMLDPHQCFRLKSIYT
jgi:hypothetical protein